jgi:hypothetical protein
MIARLKSPAFLIWLALALVLLWTGRDHVLANSGWDPDDQLRMVQLRDFLAGQSWFDTTQYRLNAPDGGPMHWSRLIELPLALLVMLLKPLFGQTAAEMAAGVIIPLGCFGLVVFMLSRIAQHIGARNAGLVAVIIAMVSPALSMQLRPMRIDHHGWQIACSALALWSLFWPKARKAGVAMGLALAFWLHISLEGAPAAIVFFALLAWRWALLGEPGERLGWTVLAFSGGSVALYFLTQPTGLSARNFCDTISPAHIYAISAAAAVMLPAAFWLPANRLVRLVAASVAGAAAIGILLWLAPQCGKGAFSTMDPIVREYWYERVTEGLPIWRQKLVVAVSLVGVPLAAIGTIGWLYRGASPDQKGKLLTLVCLLVYGSVLACLVFRTISFATMVAVPVLAIAIEKLFRRYREEQVAARRIGLVALMIMLLMPGAVIAHGATLLSPDLRAEAEPKKQAEMSSSESCDTIPAVQALSTLKNARLVAPFDIGPAILLTTPHSVLASSHHRNETGMRDHIDIYRLPEARAREIVMRRGITHIVGCLEEPEMKAYVKGDPDGLWAQLAKGDTPDWLQPVPISGSGLKVWRVSR